MTTVDSAILTDDRYVVPSAPAGPDGLAWLRAHVPRFQEGAAHAGSRAEVDRVVRRAAERVGGYDGPPTERLLAALGLPRDLATDVAAVASAYQPHSVQSAAADAAADRLVTAAGGRTVAAAAVVCVLVQAEAGVGALLAARRAGRSGPPVPTTRRVAPDGSVVSVDLTDAPYGRGTHRCPGEGLGRRLAEEARP